MDTRGNLISIIIPAYNVQNYIVRCLDSIGKQTWPYYEVIIVDDGSTDITGLLCDIYCENDKRIKVYHTENRGPGYARNYGLSKITGQWFCYVDADDWIEKDYLETLLNNAIKYQCDLSVCCYKESLKNEENEEENKEAVRIINSSKDCIHNFICSDFSMNGMVWNKLYLTQKYRDILFDINIKLYEDCLYTYNIMQNCSKACISSLELYHWFIREDSVCHSKPNTFDFDSSNVFLTLLEKTQDIYDEEIAKELKTNYTNCAVNILLNAKEGRNDKEKYKVINRLKQWRKTVWNNLDTKQKIKYFLAVYCTDMVAANRETN